MGCSQSSTALEAPGIYPPGSLHPSRSSLLARTVKTTNLSPRSTIAAEAVLADPPLFVLIASFLDGITGLLLSINREKDPSEDLPVALLAHPRRQRALEMLRDYRRLDRRPTRLRISYRSAAIVSMQTDDVRALKWFIESEFSGECDTQAMWKVATDRFRPGCFEILEVLLSNSAQCDLEGMPVHVWSRVAYFELVKWLVDRVRGILFPRDVFMYAVRVGELGIIDYFLENQPNELSSNALMKSFDLEHWQVFLRLVMDTKYTQGDHDRRHILKCAVESRDVTLIKLLHSVDYIPPPEDEVLRGIELGYDEVVELLCVLNPSLLLTIKSLAPALAASKGSLRLVQFMLPFVPTEDAAQVLDVAAASGHLDVVQLLHHHRLRCTTQAMDAAAGYGHARVVEFLHHNRTEGCTIQALVGAATNKHDAVVQYLVTHGATDGLSAMEVRRVLLLHGYFNEWATFSDTTGDDIEELGQVMAAAGATCQATTIRFICDSLGRRDLMHRAIEGAAERGSIEWLQTVRILCGSTALSWSTLAAIERAFDAEYDDAKLMTPESERVDAIQWLVLHHTNVADAMAMAMAYAAKKQRQPVTPDNNILDPYVRWVLRTRRYKRLMDALSHWQKTWLASEIGARLQRLHDQYLAGSTALRLLSEHGRPFDRLVQDAATRLLPHFDTRKQRQNAQDTPTSERDPWKNHGPTTYGKQAIQCHDLEALQLCFEVAREPTIVESELSFDAHTILLCSVASGHTDIVEWCATVLYRGELTDPGLLHHAIKYGQAQMADWLLEMHPQCCTGMGSTGSFEVAGDSATVEALEWLTRVDKRHPQLAQHVDAVAIARQLVGVAADNLAAEWLDCQWNVIASRVDEVVWSAVARRRLSAVEMILGVMARRGVVSLAGESERIQDAMAAAVREGDLEIVEYLFAHCTATNWSSAVRAAADIGHVAVFRFFLTHGYNGLVTDEAFTAGCRSEVRRLAFFCRALGVDRL